MPSLMLERRLFEPVVPLASIEPAIENAVAPRTPKPVDGGEAAKLTPCELTGGQWAKLKADLDKATRELFGKKQDGKDHFDILYPSQKIEVIKEVLRLRGPLEIVPEWSAGIRDSAYAELNKACETLSKQTGACGDVALLYVAVVMELAGFDMLKLVDIALVTGTFYDPRDKKMKGHANVVQVTVQDENSENGVRTTFMVDLAYLPRKIELKKLPEFGSHNNGDELNRDFLAHLNEDRHDGERIDAVELEVYRGIGATDAYYYQAKGLDALRSENWQNAIENFDKAVGAACDERMQAISYVAHAKACTQLIGQWNEKLTQLVGSDALDEANELSGRIDALEEKYVSDLNNALKIENPPVFAELGLVKYLMGLANRDLKDEEHRLGYLKDAEQRAREAVRKAPYDDQPYYYLGRVLADQGRAAEALEAFETALHRLKMMEGDPKMGERRKEIDDELIKIKK